MAWHVIDNFLYISLFFVLAIFLKLIVPPLKNYIIPNAILAGFIGLVLGPSVLNLIPLEFDRLGEIIYHLMAVGFISLSLRKVEARKSRTSINAGFIIAGGYLVQGFFGFLMTVIYSGVDRAVSPLMGLFLPLGFGQGPGQALAIGAQWEELGMQNGAAIGLTISAAGFAWATLGGIIILNILLRKQKGWKKRRGEIKKEVYVKNFEFSAIDGTTIQMVFIGAIYLAVFAFLTLLSNLLSNLGEFGQTMATMMWGFHFVFGALFGFLVRGVYDRLLQKKQLSDDYLNNFLLQRISGGTFDFMVAAAISAVSFSLVSDVLLPLLILTFSGGLLTFLYLRLLIARAFPQHTFANFIAMFGMLTGTISTGVALLREVDPGLETGAAENLVLGSGFAIALGLPLMALLNVPVMGFVTGQSIYYFVFLALLFIYGSLIGWGWLKKYSYAPINKKE